MTVISYQFQGHRHCIHVFLRVGFSDTKLNDERNSDLGSNRTFSITSNSRMMYAFARDGGIPGHKFFAKVSPQWKSPIRTGALNYFTSSSNNY
jgi:amino acid transporter